MGNRPIGEAFDPGAVPGPILERFAARMVESSGDGIWVIDPRGHTLYVNQRAAQLLGRSQRELSGLAVHDVLDEPGREQFDAHLHDLRTEGPSREDVECRYRLPDGEMVRILVGESELRDDDGALIGYVHRMIGDSQQLRLLGELSRSRAQLADAQAIVRLGSWEVDVQTGTSTWSPQMFAVLGLAPDSIEPSPTAFFELVHEADRAAVQDGYESVQRRAEEGSVDARVVLPDGSTRWVRSVGQVLTWSVDGRPLRIGGTVQDIDRAKQNELQLQDAVVLNTLMQFMAAAANAASTLREALATLREVLLDHPDWQAAIAFEVIGPDSDVVTPMPLRSGESAPSATQRDLALRALREQAVVLDEETTPQTPSIAFPVMLGDRPLVVAVITARTPFERQDMLRAMADQVSTQLATVAAREAVAAELATARDQAMDASRAKSDFVATVSHEIRTPLNGVIGLNDLLLRTELDERQRRLAEGMQGAGRALLRLINDILDFSKIEAGAIELERVRFRPREVIAEVVDLFTPAVAHKQIELRTEVSADVPDELVGDPGRLRQVLSNLISNAVKFTGEGQVWVRMTAGALRRQIQLRIEVSDSGVGMSSEELERVFEPFRQADASTTRDYGGTGLGLAIARQLAAALGGELGATSSPGRGSTFWFTGQFARADQAGRLSVPSGVTLPRRTGRVLVVEDNEVNQLVATGMLEALGYHVDVCDNGRAGASRALQGNYVAVLMDLQMPGTDGFEGTRLIRERESPGRHLPVVALTASATEGEREHCLAAGMDGFLTKPLSIERLDAELGRSIADVGDPSRRSAATVPDEAREPPVLDPGRLEELLEMGPAAEPLVRRAVDNFVARAEEDLRALRAWLAAPDAEKVRHTAHRLKGSAANLGAERLAAAARRVEECAAGQRLAEVPALLVDLERDTRDAVAALREHGSG